MKFTQKQIIIVAGGALLVIVVALAIYFGARNTQSTEKITLTAWGTDPKNVFDDIASAYKTINQGVTVNYTRFDPDNYQDQLLKAFAAGTGPDLFEMGNRELPKWLTVTAPIPAQMAPTFSLTTLQNNFPTVVAQDFVNKGSIYALPLDLDTLAMFYNKDIFDSVGIVYPPKTWDELQANIPKLRNINAQGQIAQSAVALGGSRASIAVAPDLIFLLMLQNGAKMISNDGSSAVFNSSVQSGGSPGLSAFNFYLQFANAASPYYSWNDAMGDSVQAFIAGKTAIMFDYSSAVSKIKQKAPFLNFGVAPMLQPTNATLAVNYPKYTGLAVSRRGQVNAAWQFVLFATNDVNGQRVYVKDTGKLPAGRAYIAANLNDPTYGAFASQALTARSWREADDTKIDAAIDTAIQRVLDGSMDSAHALGVAQGAVTAVMQNR